METTKIYIYHHIYICGFPEIWEPPDGWFMMENPMKVHYLGGTPILGNHHMYTIHYMNHECPAIEVICAGRLKVFCRCCFFHEAAPEPVDENELLDATDSP